MTENFYEYLVWALRFFMEKRMGWNVALIKNEETRKIFRVDLPADSTIQDMAKGAILLIKTFIETLAIRTRQLQNEANIQFKKEDFEERYQRFVANAKRKLLRDNTRMKKHSNLNRIIHEELPGFIENKSYIFVELEKVIRNEIYLTVKCLWDWEVRENTFLHKIVQLEKLSISFPVYLLETNIHVEIIEEIKKNMYVVTCEYINTFSNTATRIMEKLAQSIVDIWYLYEDIRSYMKKEEEEGSSGAYLSFLWYDYPKSFKRIIELLIKIDRRNPDEVQRFFNVMSVITDMIGYSFSPERFYHFFKTIREAVEKGLL
ncbi:hypothetical protein Rm378p006 [Rhodothermus phage RM378]|uniref:hypothetical protein n=1 Tax=Rhodothermus phage RM378 TaxID=148943 RepID=UPI000018F618|nr:hypothetical protein Rm378p006 [Rhodothermus phage RM378]